MALLSKVVDRNDSRQLTVRGTFSSEPFPNAADSGALKVVDEYNSPWTFIYKISRKERILSGPDWVKFFGNNKVQDGDEVAIHHNDGWDTRADYRIEVIRGSSN